jgi:hypothetical protein
LKRRSVLAFFQKLPPCLVGIEACASSHHWSRELQALGHTVRLMPPAYVKPYVKRQKNDAADAEAICEAVTRANMRFVPTKTLEQQSCLMLHRTRHLFIRQQTVVINSRSGLTLPSSALSRRSDARLSDRAEELRADLAAKQNAEAAGWFGFVAGYDDTSLGLNYCSPTQVVVPSVSWATVLQGTALTVFVETPSRPTMFKPGPVTASGNEPATGGVGVAPSAGADA